MPLGRSPRKPDKPSSSGLPKDALYDQLLSSLTGSEGIASEGACIRWAREQARAGRNPLPIDPQAPWPIQRGQAVHLLQAVDWPSYLEGHWVCAEARAIETEIQEENCTPCGIDTNQIFAAFNRWRNALISRFHLEAQLLPAVPPNP